jgi:hypothetical protein
MIKQRWKVETWTEYTEDGNAKEHSEKPVLQYKHLLVDVDIHGNLSAICFRMQPKWSEWIDVPTEYIET